MQDRVFIVTGSNSGIGLVTARELARTGGRVVMACRNLAKAEEARKQIVEATRNEKVEVMQVDVGDLASLRAFATAFKAKYDRLDVLVNNAGVSLPTREVTGDGFERMFAINHVGYHGCACLLADVLVRTPGARVVNVASEGHRLGRFDVNNLQCKKSFNAVLQYSTTKLHNVLFSALLAQKLAGWFGTMVKLAGPFMISTDKGALTSLHLALSPDVAGVTGLYFSSRKPCRTSGAGRDMKKAEQLWAYTVDKTGIDLPAL
jgi:NAD(P)-dependent dehydrogenase (short-subunit alcohol dehydrogenase family)